jgi:hypothetical protein
MRKSPKFKFKFKFKFHISSPHLPTASTYAVSGDDRSILRWHTKDKRGGPGLSDWNLGRHDEDLENLGGGKSSTAFYRWTVIVQKQMCQCRLALSMVFRLGCSADVTRFQTWEAAYMPVVNYLQMMNSCRDWRLRLRPVA